MIEQKRISHHGGASAFTLIEIIVVVVILAVAGLIAVPMMSSAADMQVRAAANRLAADLDYAKNLAITHQRPFTVIFDAVNESYEIQDHTGTAIKNPLRPASDFRISFPSEHSMSRVQIVSAEFVGVDTEATVTFDYLGTPYSGSVVHAGENLNSSGTVTLQDLSGDFTLYVKVEPMTGYVTVEAP